MDLMSRIVLGTVQMGLHYGINNKSGQIPISEAMDILLSAHRHGILSLDTAAAYGTAHEVIGHFHQLHPEIRFNINTKFPHEIQSPVDQLIHFYLKQLNVSKLNTIFFHSFQSFISHKNYLDSILELKYDQVVNNIGVSVYNNDEVHALLDEKMIDVIQLPYNLLDNYSQRGHIIDLAKQKGKIIQSRSTFLQGLFFSSTDGNNQEVKALHNELSMIEDLSAKYDISIYSMAILYCMANQDIDQVLIGVDSLSQLEDLFKIRNTIINEDIVDVINQIHVNNKDLLNPSLWKKQ